MNPLSILGTGKLGELMALETTLVLIKPGGVQRNLIGEITRRIEARSLRIVGLKLIHAERATVEAHYDEHRERPFFGSVCDYLTSAPIVALAVQGENAVKAIRAMMGATNPVDAAPGTIRGDFALSIEDNLTHSSSDPEAAARELGLWFAEGTF
jgi:nucleoside-diphosphate kinase